MRGQIKIGRWVPFRAQEVLTPTRGFVWRARAAGLIFGSDHYVNGHGGMDWKLAALLRVIHAEGPDVSRATAERAGAKRFGSPPRSSPGSASRGRPLTTRTSPRTSKSTVTQ